MSAVGSLSEYGAAGTSAAELAIIKKYGLSQQVQSYKAAAQANKAINSLRLTNRVLTRAGYLGTGIQFFLDMNDLYRGNMQPERFAFRTANVATSAAIGYKTGGAWGGIIGTAVGALGELLDYSIHNIILPKAGSYFLEKTLNDAHYPKSIGR